MLTVRDFALGASKPEEMKVFVRGSEYNLISDYSGEVDTLMLELFGDYVVENYRAEKPDEYTIWVVERPVKIQEMTSC